MTQGTIGLLPKFSSGESLRLLENLGLTGTWKWQFSTGDHSWSPGLFRLLGLEQGVVQPSYDQIYALAHPEDRKFIATAAEVMIEGFLIDHVFRVIRPDGRVRFLQHRGDIHVSPDGRPQAASGVLLDVTDRERLMRVQMTERARRRAMFEYNMSFFSSAMDLSGKIPPMHELDQLTGISDLHEDVYQGVCSTEREHWRLLGAESFMSGQVSIMTPLVVLANKDRVRFRGVSVPVRNAAGLITEWHSFTQPITEKAPDLDLILEGLEQAVHGNHLRAARALLDWSMMDLARASGLSFSTIRRLEEGGEIAASRSRHAAVAALREAGIRFSFLDDGILAVAKA